MCIMVIYVGTKRGSGEESLARGGRQVSLRRIDSSSRVKVMAANREIYGWRIYKSRGRRVNVELRAKILEFVHFISPRY